MITALAACDAADVIVVGCDLAYLTVGTVHALVAADGAAPVAVVVTDRVQPLCARWSNDALETVRSLFAGGERRLMSVLGQLVTQHVTADPQDLTNVNTPGDLPE